MSPLNLMPPALDRCPSDADWLDTLLEEAGLPAASSVESCSVHLAKRVAARRRCAEEMSDAALTRSDDGRSDPAKLEEDTMAPFLSRRVSLAAALLGCLAICPLAVNAAEDKIIVAHAAGINGQSVERLLADYTRETRVKAEGVTLSDTDFGAKVQLVARTGNPPFDVVLGVPVDVFNLTKGSGIYANFDLTKWDQSVVAAMRENKLLGPQYAITKGPAALLVYSSTLRVEPKTWADLFDTTKIPGNRGMASGGLGVPINFEYALIASGVAPDKIYPLDYERALKELNRIKSTIVLYDNAPKAIQDIVSGDTVMAWSFAPAALSAIQNGQKIKLVVPPGSVVATQLAVAMSKAPNGTDAANKFLAWYFRPENQKKYSEGVFFGNAVPATPILDLFTKAQMTYMPFSGGSKDNYRDLNYDYYAAKAPNGQSNLADALSRWAAFRSR